MTYSGHCLCGGIAFRIEGALAPIQVCHCSQCRRAQGTAFATNVPVARADFHLERGAELVNEYESSPGKLRAFCRRCGSPLYSRRDNIPETLRLRVGLLDGSLDTQVSAHFCVSSKANWWPIDDGLPQYDGPFKPEPPAA